MHNYLKISLLFMAALALQVTLFPAYLLDPFRPNLLIIFVVFMGFRTSLQRGASFSFLIGLLHDSVSGLYLGLHAFSYLLIFFVLNRFAHRFYTDNSFLIILGVLGGTLVNGLASLILLSIFSTSIGSYSFFLGSLLPQALTNALIASLFFNFFPL
ncbi:MAG TPA: rod shape-determining protein MreD, partial [Geobacterales bacterium]|nr:rod shape-determining protein MreD [Geobacterales bacterium]